MYTSVHVCLHVCGGPKLVSGIFLDPSSLYYLRQGFSIKSWGDQQTCLASQLTLGIRCLCLGKLELLVATAFTQHSHCLWGSKLWSSCWCGKHFDYGAITLVHSCWPCIVLNIFINMNWCCLFVISNIVVCLFIRSRTNSSCWSWLMRGPLVFLFGDRMQEVFFFPVVVKVPDEKKLK